MCTPLSEFYEEADGGLDFRSLSLSLSLSLTHSLTRSLTHSLTCCRHLSISRSVEQGPRNYRTSLGSSIVRAPPFSSLLYYSQA